NQRRIVRYIREPGAIGGALRRKNDVRWNAEEVVLSPRHGGQIAVTNHDVSVSDVDVTIAITIAHHEVSASVLLAFRRWARSACECNQSQREERGHDDPLLHD